jgi:hypothetical protein
VDENETITVQIEGVNMLLPRGYFTVFGAMLSHTGNPKEAWWATEMEFNRRYSLSGDPEVLRRYTTYDSFCEARRQFRQGVKHGHIEIVILEMPEI